ncbi:MAG: TetR/AcrR family transcriptional regulator [Treponema sp.]|jgi:TetR/AcrR family transcriptional regulator|nr:TetR/AcrR family transcriptional regulator [Treponema sp.]
MVQTSDTKGVILETALLLFSRKGYESVGVQEIVTTAGITKPTLYYYFKSKQGLLEAIVAEYGAVFISITRKAAEYRHNLVVNLRDLFQETLNFAHEHPAFYRLSQNLFSSAPETAGYAVGVPFKGELVSTLEGLFIAAAGDHGNMKNREHIYAETFMGLLETWAMLSINGEAKLNDYLQYRIIHHFMHGIFS